MGDAVCPWGGGLHSVALDQVGGWFRFPSPPGARGQEVVLRTGSQDLGLREQLEAGFSAVGCCGCLGEAGG